MITKVTKDNKGLYRALFEKATSDLAAAHPGEASVTITSLDDYFRSIKDLTQLNGGKNTYAVLPLDEPFFEIDANTRVITVPSEFKTNGISVKGDQIAEILFFTIDRYYDTVDLYDPSVQIFIQCEGPDGVQHVYNEFLRDISLLKTQGKMVFGWTIDNKITTQSGPLKFSVRFITTALNENQESEIIFSLSTLTANAIINPGLDFEFTGNVPTVGLIDNKNMVRKRIVNSVPSEEGEDVASIPVFFLDIPTSASDIFLTETITATINNRETEVALKNIDLDENGIYKFSVIATSEDGGLITYDWYRANIGANLVSADPLTSAVDEFTITTDTVWETDHPYYTRQVVNGITSYLPVSVTQDMVGEEIEVDAENGVGPYYIKSSTYTANGVGDYWVVAKNRIGNAVTEKASTYVRIPGPEALSIETAAGLALNTEAVDNDANEFEANDHYMVHLNTEGGFSLTATGKTARFNDTRLTDAIKKKDKITYVWTDSDNEPIKDTAVKDNGAADTYTHANIQEADRGAFDEIYQVAIKASRNGTDTATVITKFRVTDTAHVPVVTAHQQEIRKRSGETVTLAVDVSTANIVSDNLTYQWYKIIADEEGQELPGTNDAPIDGATNATFDTDGDGMYYCLVTNHVNGTTATSPVPDPEVAIDRAKYTSISVY